MYVINWDYNKEHASIISLEMFIDTNVYIFFVVFKGTDL